MGNIVTGKYAYVEGVAHTKSWQMNEAGNLGKYMDSAVPDGSATVDGNHDFTGSVSGNGYNCIYPDIEDFEFVGVANGRSGQYVNYEGIVLFMDTTVNIPVAASGGIIDWTANWGSQGELIKTTGQTYLDEDRTPAVPAKNGKVAIEAVVGSDTYADVDRVQNIRLTFRRNAATYVDDGYTFREAGNLECDLSFDVQSDDLMNPQFVVGSEHKIKIFVTNTLFFLFDAVQFGDKTNFVVSTDGNSILGYTVNAMWSGLITRSPNVLGTIIKPGGEVLYPVVES